MNISIDTSRDRGAFQMLNQIDLAIKQIWLIKL